MLHIGLIKLIKPFTFSIPEAKTRCRDVFYGSSRTAEETAQTIFSGTSWVDTLSEKHGNVDSWLNFIHL